MEAEGKAAERIGDVVVVEEDLEGNEDEAKMREAQVEGECCYQSPSKNIKPMDRSQRP